MTVVAVCVFLALLVLIDRITTACRNEGQPDAQSSSRGHA